MVAGWSTPGLMTDAGAFHRLLTDLPTDAAGIARVVQGLLVHEAWTSAYGVTLTEHDRDLVNLRRVEDGLVRGPLGGRVPRRTPVEAGGRPGRRPAAPAAREDVVDAALFDELAGATAGPSMSDVRRLMGDDRLRVPDEVDNVQHRRREPL